MNISYSTKAKVLPLLLLTLAGFSNSTNADVYRWRDNKGVMQYSDVPPASLTKNKKSEALLLKLIKEDSLCANPDLKTSNAKKNDPIVLNLLFNQVNTTLAQKSPNSGSAQNSSVLTQIANATAPAQKNALMSQLSGATTAQKNSVLDQFANASTAQKNAVLAQLANASTSQKNALLKQFSNTSTAKQSAALAQIVNALSGQNSGFRPIESSVSSSTPSGVSVAVTQPSTGSTSGTTTGSTSGTTTGSTSGTTTGSTSGTTTGSTSGTTTGSTSGTTTGSTSGTTTGSTSGTTTGSTTVATTYPPKVAVGCNGNMETCTIPAGVTAKVWFGVHTKWTTKENVTGSIGCNATAMGDPKSGAYNRCFYVDNKLLAKNLDPKGLNLMPAVNTSLAPRPAVGFSTPLIKAAAIPKAESFPYAGAFRISCEYSHMSNDDPIVFPGVPNATHHHTFFGNTGANAYSTNASLRNSGNSTCAGGILNRSGYWMPSLINTSNGAPSKPSVVVVYYKAVDEKSGMYMKAPPAGLRMIAGNARPLAVADAEGGFFCQDQTQVMNPANWGIIWQGSHIKQSCGGPNQMLRMIVTFPQCWDGKNLDSPDHKSHMAFSCGDECENAQGVVTKSANSCPASHPVQIPNITINADFPGLDANAKYRLASDNYSTAYPGGYSLHADWMNGWDEEIIGRVVKNCINNPKNCGGPNLGDGEILYGVNVE
ncbi:MAG: hypothetical protein B7Y48_07420 [Methylophilales bacterium 28-44-11]|nr:MAG: hypothetical protein B7Y48_07420 [Methylophilales bacterium 28-44-11]